MRTNTSALQKAKYKLKILDAEKADDTKKKKKVIKQNDEYLLKAISSAMLCTEYIQPEQTRLKELIAEYQNQQDTDKYWEIKSNYYKDQIEIIEETYPLFSAEAKRRKNLIQTINSTGQWEIEREKCKEDTLYWFDNYAWTSDPRKVGIWSLPFMLYPYQREAVTWLEDLIFSKKTSGVIEKSRDLGFSWLLISLFYKHFQHSEGFHALIGSITANECDTIGDPSSMFEKIREQARLQPVGLLPSGWDRNISYMKAINPVTKSTITGSTSNADFGRGGRFSCLTGDTLIQTPDGNRPIKELAETAYPEIIGIDGKIKKVRGYIVKPKEPVYKVTTRGGFSLTGTKDHPLLKVRTNGELEKTEISKLKVHDKLRLITNTPKGIDTMSLETAKILGYLVSEGYVVRTDGTIQFCNSNKEIVEDFDTLWKSVFPNTNPRYTENTSISSITGKTSCWKTITINSVKTRKYLKELGLTYTKSAYKEIPEAILKGTKDIKINFLQSLFEGDGSIGTYNGKFRVSYSSQSIKLLTQLQILLLEFGIISTKITGKNRKELNLHMNGYNGFLFCQQIGFISTIKKSKQPTELPDGWRVKPFDAEIISIEEAGEEITYDLECEGHKFIANGLASHNCILFDEFSSFEMDTAAMTASSQSSPCKIYNSTAKGMGNEFYRLANSGKIEKKTFHWTVHPYKTQSWYDYQKIEMSDIQIAQELDINYESSQHNKVYSEYQEHIHVVTKSEVIRALPSFGDMHGNFRIPFGHSIYMGEDVGQTEEHAHMMLWFATLKENTITTDGIDLSGSVLIYRELQQSPKSPPRIWAESIKKAEGDLEKNMVSGRFISHEAVTEAEIYSDEYGLNFINWKPDYTTGISRVKDYLDVVFKESIHPFREYTRKQKYPNAPPILGRPHIYIVVDDEQGELLFNESTNSYSIIPAKDNNGFIRTRFEFPLYHYPQSELGKEVKRMRPRKKDDDALDVIRCIATECFPPVNKENRFASIEKELPSGLRLDSIRELPTESLGMAFLQRNQQIREKNKHLESIGINYRDQLIKDRLC